MAVKGTAEGELRATGHIQIEQSAKVNASVDGRDVSVGGHVSGKVTAQRKAVPSELRNRYRRRQDGPASNRGRGELNGNVSMNAAGEAAQQEAAQEAGLVAEQ